MTRFARAKGSKSSNEKAPEDGTPWEVMKEQLLKAKKEGIDAKKRHEAEQQRIENYENFLKEQKIQKRKATWCDFPETQNDKNSSLSHKPSPKKKKKKNKSKEQITITDDSLPPDNSQDGDDSSAQTKQKKKKNKANNQLTITNESLTEENYQDGNDSAPTEQKKSKKKNKNNKRTEGEKDLNSSNNCGVKDDHNKTDDVNPEIRNLSVTTEIKKKKNKKKKNKKPKVDLENSINNTNGSEMENNDNQNSEMSNSQTPKKKGKGNKFNPNGEEKDKSQINKENKIKALKKKKDKKLVNGQPVRRKEINERSFQLIINGKDVELVRFDGFPIMRKDADRLEDLKKSMMSKGIPKSEVQRTLKLERRRAEKALARLKRDVCYNCRKGGHNLSDCPELKSKIPGADAAEGVCFKCGSTEHRQFECKVQRDKEFRFATCFICKEQGHIARQCPDNPKGLYPNGGCCKLCGDVTHLRKDCPTANEKKEDTSVKLQTLDSTDNIEDIGQQTQTQAVSSEGTVKKPKKIKF